MSMPVVTEAYKVTGIRSKTNSKFFENVQVGDVLVVKVELTTLYSSPKATISNLRTSEIREDVLSRIGSGLLKLTYERWD